MMLPVISYLSDPDAGTSSYTYAADGTLLTQTDGRGIKTTNSYDNLGRLVSTQIGRKTIVYTYGTAGNEKLRLVRLASDNNSVEYTHDLSNQNPWPFPENRAMDIC